MKDYSKYLKYLTSTEPRSPGILVMLMVTGITVAAIGMALTFGSSIGPWETVTYFGIQLMFLGLYGIFAKAGFAWVIGFIGVFLYADIKKIDVSDAL